MLRKNFEIIIGLTTFNHEFLKLSISGLVGAHKNVLLVIYNDNPCKKLSKKYVRRLGYRGNLIIINTDENSGTLRARIALIEHIKKNKLISNWFMFANDDDVVLNTTVPSVSDNTFAIMGNSVVVASGLINVMRIMDNSQDFTIDGVDNMLIAPHIGMSGTLVRMDTMIQYADFMTEIIDKIHEITDNTPFAPPIDLIMWNILVEYMRKTHPNMSPIYMNQNNYLMTKLNGTRRATDVQAQSMIERVMSVANAALRGNE